MGSLSMTRTSFLQNYMQKLKRRDLGKEFGDLWKTLNDHIDELGITHLADINSILMQYMYYIRTIKKETVSETGAINVTTPGLRRYFTAVNKGPLTDPIGMCSDMIRLAEIWEKFSDSSLMKVLLKFNENSKLFLASYFFRFNVDEIKDEDVEPVLACLLRLFSLLELLDVGYSSKYFKTFFVLEKKPSSSTKRSLWIKSYKILTNIFVPTGIQKMFGKHCMTITATLSYT